MMDSRNKMTSMAGLAISITIMAALIPVALLVPVAVENERFVNIELLSEASNPDARVRREADSNLPDHLNFQVPMATGDITLRMKRSKLVRTATSHSEATTPFSENAAVYTDLEKGASMLVKREAGDYSLHGSFLHDNNEWNLEPLDRARRQASQTESESERRGSGSHRLFPGPPPDMQTISMVGDTVVDDEPPVEILSLADRNRHRQDRMRARSAGQSRDVSADQGQATSTGPQTRGGNRRSKREAVQHTVELVFVVDYADYEKWVSFKGASNAVNEMTLWYTYVAEAINIRYRSITDPDIAMSTVVTFLRILT
ncbi:hypothetical protein EGW08_003318, partial [Elysia chlorotica]